MTALLQKAFGESQKYLALFLASAGYSSPGSIPAEMTFLQWVEDLASKGLMVDNHPFSLAERRSFHSPV